MVKQLEKVFSLILRHPLLLLVFSATITLLSLYFSQKIRLRTNFSDLLPDNHPAVVEAKELEKIVGGASFIVVTVRSEDSGAADRFLTDLHSRIEGIDGIHSIDDRPPTEFFRKNGLLYLSLPDLDRLHEGIKRRIEKGKLEKARLFVNLEEGEGVDREIETFQKKYAAYLQPAPRYQNIDGTLFVSLIKPEWRATDSDRTRALLERLDQVILKLDPSSFHPSLQVRFTGPYVKALTQQRILLKDAVLVSAIAFLGAILYLFIHFRSLRAVFLIGLPLFAGTLWMLAIAYFLFGSLNLFSSVACAILLGLGVDYGIHIYSEYSRGREAGQAVPEALRASMKHLGRALSVASTTTAAAFFALTLSEFKALHEFGMVAGFGLFLCLLSFLTLFPSLVLLLEKWKPAPKPAGRQVPQRNFLRPLSPKFLLVTGIFLLAPLASVGLGRLRFDYDLNHVLGSQETKGLDAEVDRIFNHTVNPEVALTRNPNDSKNLA
ncbi:MAG: MMPL family transporter, partial [Deltaproteobacteria bacterium]|nr:MMPL family transporter [Deltaproteobacteria bacterium]